MRTWRYIYLLILIPLFTRAQSGGFRSRVFAQNSLSHTTFDIIETTPGSYFGAGVFGDTNAVPKLAVVGLDSHGAKVWEKQYGNENLQFVNHPFAYRSMCKKNGHVYLGIAMKDSTSSYIGSLIKFNFNGNIIWQRYYRDSVMRVMPFTVNEAADGGFLMTGYLESTASPVYRKPILLLKLDSEGHEVWQKALDWPTPNYNEGKMILQDSVSRKIVICGYQLVGPMYTENFRQNIIVLDSTGNILSSTLYNSGELRDLVQSSDGKFVSVGVTWQSGGISYLSSPYAMKFDIDNPASPIWKIESCDSLGEENCFVSAIQLPDNNILIGGSYDSLFYTVGKHNPLSRFLCVSPSGQILKKRYYSYGPADTTQLDVNIIRMRCMNPTSDGGWVTSIRCGNIGNNPMFLVKYDATGCDTTAEYCRTVGLEESFPESVKVFPNPFTGEFSVTTDFRIESGFENVQLFDVTGNGLDVGYYYRQNRLAVDGNGLNPGIYFLRLNISGRTVVRKIVKYH